jgi:hypothetical protein
MQLCSIVLLTLIVTAARPLLAAEHDITPPPTPVDLRVSSDFKPFLLGHGVGTQNYICKPVGNGFGFVLFTPEATLFNDEGKQLITHFFSPNPAEANTDPTVVADRQIRVTWQDSQDTSSVWAKVKAPSTDSAFVAQGAVAWLLLEVVGTTDGPRGVGALSKTKFIQRLNTSGGLAPSTGCASLADVGKQAFVPYTADYFFYEKDPRRN